MQNIPNNALLRLPQVLALIPVSRSAWWAGCKSGRYPKPVKLGPRTKAWRALTGCPCFPAMDGCGRRTRKPPAGALSKEVRCSKTQTQQYKKAFSASRNFPAYRQAADTMHIRPPRLALRRVLPIHAL